MKRPATMNAEPAEYVTLDDAAKRAGVTRRTIQNKLSSGEIPKKAVRLDGKQKLVRLDAVRAACAMKTGGETSAKLHGEVLGNFIGSPSPLEVIELQARVQSLEAINTHLEKTLAHERDDRAKERTDREREREHWRTALERTQATLLAAQDNPTSRALAGAPTATVDASPIVESTEADEPPPATTGRAQRRTQSTGAGSSPWWQFWKP